MDIGTLTGEITLVDQMTAVMAKLDSVLQATDIHARKTADGIDQLESSTKKAALTGALFGTSLGNIITGTLTRLPQLIFQAGQEISGAMATIARKTGETGVVLEGLQKSFRTVFRQVPEDAQTVSAALGDVNVRLGFTGEKLEKVTKQILDFANVNRVDAAAATRTVTTLMKALEVDVSQVSLVMDKLTFASQQSGASVTQLAHGMIQGGIAFKELGFGLDESLALFSQFERVGANVTDVTSSLHRTLARLAKEGFTDAKSAFAGLLEDIKKAPTFMDATRKAVEAFGAKAGPKLVEEIRGGTYELGKFVKALQGVGGLTERTAAQTESFDEKMAKLRKRITEILEPLGKRMLDAFGQLVPVIETASTGITTFSESLKGIASQASIIPTPLQNVALAIGGVTLAIYALNTAVTALMGTAIVRFLAGATGSLAWAFSIVASQIEIFGVWTGVLSSRFVILSRAGAAVTAFLSGPGGLAILFAAAAAGAYELIGAVDRLIKHLEQGKSALEFFTAKNDNNFVRKVLGWIGVLDEIDHVMRIIGEYATSVWQTLGEWIEWAAETGLGRFYRDLSELVTKIAGWSVIIAGEGVWALLAGAVETATNAYRDVGTGIQVVWNLLTEPVVGDAASMLGDLTKTIQVLADVLKVTLAAAIELVVQKFQPLIDAVRWLNENIPKLPVVPTAGQIPLPGATTSGFVPLAGPAAAAPSGARPPQPGAPGPAGTRIDPDAKKAADEYEKKVKELVGTLRNGDQALKVFADAFKRLTPAQLENFAVQERLVPQILKMVEAGKALTPTMQETLEKFQANRAALADSEMEVLRSIDGIELRILAMEKMGMSEAEIAHAFGVSAKSLDLYTAKINEAAAISEANRARDAAAWKLWADRVQDSALRAMNIAGEQASILEDLTEKRTALVNSMRMDPAEAQIEAATAALKKQIKEYERLGQLTPEIQRALQEIHDTQIKEIRLEGALQQFERFNKSVGDTKALFDRMTQAAMAWAGGFGSTIANLVQTFSGLSPLLKQFVTQVQQTIKGGGWANAWSGMKDGLKGVLEGVPQTLVSAFTGGGDIMGAIKGIASQIGSVLGKGVATALGFLGPIGQAIGAAVGSLVGPLISGIQRLFAGRPAHEDIARRVAGWAGPISEGLSKAIAEVAKKDFGGDRLRAEVFSLDKIVGEVGLNAANIETMTAKLRDVFVFVADGTFTMAQGIEVLDKNFTAFLEHSTDEAGNWSSSIKEIIDLADRMGLQSEAIRKAQQQQADALIASSGAIIAVFEEQNVKADEVAQHMQDLSEIAKGSFFAAIVAGESFTAALLKSRDGLKLLRESYQELGLVVDDPFLQMLFVQEQVLTNNPRLLQGIDALSQQLVAQSNLNLLNAGSFESLGRVALQMYSRLQGEVAAVGGTTRDALLPMQGFLQQAAAKAKELGLPLEQNLQTLIDQSKELGIWSDLAATPAEKQMAATEKLTASIDRLTMALDGIPSELPDPFRNWNPPDIQAPGEHLGGIEEGANAAAAAVDHLNYGASPGGLVDIPMLLAEAASASGDFAVTMIDHMRNVYDAVDDPTAIENQTRKIEALADSIKLIPEAPFAGWIQPEITAPGEWLGRFEGDTEKAKQTFEDFIRFVNDPDIWHTMGNTTAIEAQIDKVHELAATVRSIPDEKPDPFAEWQLPALDFTLPEIQPPVIQPIISTDAALESIVQIDRAVRELNQNVVVNAEVIVDLPSAVELPPLPELPPLEPIVSTEAAFKSIAQIHGAMRSLDRFEIITELLPPEIPELPTIELPPHRADDDD